MGYFLSDGARLCRADGRSFCQFIDELPYTAFHFSRLRIFQHVFIHHFVFSGKFIRLKVIVYQQHGVFSYLDLVNHAAVVVAPVVEHACR